MHKLAAVSVDLDEIDNYASIHGLAASAAPTGLNAVYQRGLPRLSALFAELEVPATFFVIGKDAAGHAAALRALHHQGHELANHTLNHLYDLTRRDPETQRREVLGGADAIAAATGVRPRGFRAPGYTITDGLVAILGEAGCDYDSSVFPCPPYFLAKALAMGWIRLRGRSSHSVLDTPRVLLAPADPYRLGKPYYRAGAGLVELPIGVTGNLTGRLPFIGTSLVSAGPAVASTLARWVSGRPFVNLELHGIDLCDAQEDGLSWLAAHQPDLRRTAHAKRQCLHDTIVRLRQQGYHFVTLTEAAAQVV